jgi:hypothetical protein
MSCGSSGYVVQDVPARDALPAHRDEDGGAWSRATVPIASQNLLPDAIAQCALSFPIRADVSAA